MDEHRKAVEEALVRWAEEQGGWRTSYHFDCGELGIVRLFVLVYHNTRYWECRWLDVEPCPVLAEFCETAVRRAQGGEWLRVGVAGAEYEVNDEAQID